MPVFEGDYSFIDAGLSDRSYAELPEVLVHREYKDIAESFKASLDRLMSFFELPLQLIYWSARISVIKHIARYRCGLSPEDDSRDHELQVSEAVKRVWDEIVRPSQGTRTVSFSTGVLATMLGDRGSTGIDPAREGVEAVLAAMVMASYAAFETLAADLWVEAVNRHNSLATNWMEKNSEKQIPGAVLASYEFNVSSYMGTILHSTKKVSFESLNDIRNLYRQAFKGAMDDAFEPIDDLVKAEKTRHLFAHRGGLVDRKFKDQMKDYPEYTSAVIGERLRLTGPVTGSYVAACAKCGVALLKAIDNWSVAQT